MNKKKIENGHRIRRCLNLLALVNEYPGITVVEMIELEYKDEYRSKITRDMNLLVDACLVEKEKRKDEKGLDLATRYYPLAKLEFLD